MVLFCLQAAVDAVEELSFLLELLVVLREYPFSKEAESLLLNTWFERYPAHPLTLDTRARLLLEQVGVFPLHRRRSPCCSTPGLGAIPPTLSPWTPGPGYSWSRWVSFLYTGGGVPACLSFTQEAESLLLNTWFQRYPAHPLTLDTRARLLLEQVSVFPLHKRQSPCCSTPGLSAIPPTLSPWTPGPGSSWSR
jgi:hypothetical protein